METNDLVKLGVRELDTEEMETSGGWWQAALAIAGAVIYIYNNADDFVSGFNEGRQAGYK